MCDCFIKNRPEGFFLMSSDELRAYGEAHDRPDIVRHSACKKEHEKLDALSDEFEALCCLPLYNDLPHRLRSRIWCMNVYLLTGARQSGEEFPQDGALAAGRRLLDEAFSFRESEAEEILQKLSALSACQ